MNKRDNSYLFSLPSLTNSIGAIMYEIVMMPSGAMYLGKKEANGVIRVTLTCDEGVDLSEAMRMRDALNATH